jgi:hypothetical protein
VKIEVEQEVRVEVRGVIDFKVGGWESRASKCFAVRGG